jgi:DNA helicase-2/ATP-dependent DNA helicase PcrA
VLATEGDRLDIDFETSGEKRVLSNFVERHDA